jgi:hypothetical protein
MFFSDRFGHFSGQLQRLQIIRCEAPMMMPPFISKIPMKVSLPQLFTAPVFCVVIFLSVIAFSEGKNTASDLMAQNLVQIHNHIEERLDDLLNLPKWIQQINASLIVEGWLDLNQLRSWQPTLVEQVLTFRGLSSVLRKTKRWPNR